MEGLNALRNENSGWCVSSSFGKAKAIRASGTASPCR